MRLLKKSVEMVAWFDYEGNTTPVKFRLLNEEEENTVIKVNKIIKRELDKFAGNKMMKYTCESCINGEIKLLELRYELETCKWYLYKI
ncbi:hypothetical protein [Alkaliphilus peptidifermentans]|uniref:Uncharacterized protein n=1 Tax=Alkaliphilus peptidifermentans DSM 18978 TaxID=1120976 RepID=A0A1G5L800_9FIRM|nr:hypothetical protein [Alkaliphilus peptidifermentans]SCZ08458.1 hypothetical protein SAMN03080606_04120 [Alkaliphilus peptidifermentans DSM 18978]